MTGHGDGVTDVTDVPYDPQCSVCGTIGKSVTSVTRPDGGFCVDAIASDRITVHPGAFGIFCLCLLEKHLRSPAWEYQWTGKSIAEIVTERNQQIECGVSRRWFCRHWLMLRAIDVKSYCLLTGNLPRQVSQAIRNRDLSVIVNPAAYKIYLPIEIALASGFSIDEVKRARGGEDINFSRLLKATLEV